MPGLSASTREIPVWASVEAPCEIGVLSLVKDKHFVVPGTLLLCELSGDAAVASLTWHAENSVL